MQAFSYTWSDFIFTIILWGSQYPVFQTENQRLREFTRQLKWLPQHLNPGPAVPEVHVLSLTLVYSRCQGTPCAWNTAISDSSKQTRLCYTHARHSHSCRPRWYIKSRGPSLDHRQPFLTYNWDLPFTFCPTTIKLLSIDFIVIISFITLTIIIQYILSVSDETCRRWKILGWVGMLQIVSVLFISVLILHGLYFYMQFKEQVA